MRSITEEIFSDEWFGMLSPVYRLLWIGLIVNVADDQGRMLDNPALIRATLFPYDDDIKLRDIEKGLTLFAVKHKITRYGNGTNGSTRKLIQINKWWRYQKSAQWAGRSQFPAPPKWQDRIRAHEAGSIKPITENWDSIGGYEAATKRLRSGNEAAAKPLPLPKDKDKDEVKDSLSVKRAREFFAKSQISIKAADYKSIEEIFPSVKDDDIIRAVKVAKDNGKHSAAYVLGILRNWRAEKNAVNQKRVRQSNDGNTGAKPKGPSATAIAAAKIIAERQAKSNV